MKDIIKDRIRRYVMGSGICIVIGIVMFVACSIVSLFNTIIHDMANITIAYTPLINTIPNFVAFIINIVCASVIIGIITGCCMMIGGFVLMSVEEI